MKKTLYLVCNAHLDPVWLWEWEEGAGEALSTFRSAAKLCDEFEEFVFNHNEALLYKWIEDFEPELFKKLQDLVSKKKWHIMGGWYVQSDCNIPSGESLVRQILVGKRYFQKKFGVEPKTAINFDPFGHTRGLAQILAKSGYSSYLFCRPDPKGYTLSSEDFVWVGYDGSEILARRATDHYNSFLGKACQRVEEWLEKNLDEEFGILLWGIGNHGGGPSRLDLEDLRKLREGRSDWRIQHATPEDYFECIAKDKARLPRHSSDLNPWAVGCYTTMARIKKKHRALENAYYKTEKMVTSAFCNGMMDYPYEQLEKALEDLLFCEFHDILPGSCISEAESAALQRMDHGLEVLARLKAKAFFAHLSGEAPAEEGEFPIFVYNPHPFPVDETVVCEFQPQEPNENKGVFMFPEIIDKSRTPIPFQLEKESCNISVDQRKRVVFRATLEPCQMNRFSCRLKEVIPDKNSYGYTGNEIEVKSANAQVIVDTKSGFIKAYRVDGIDYLSPGAFQALVVEDYPDPWGMKVDSFRKVAGFFTLMTKEESGRFAGISLCELDPVRVIEDGPVRTVVEALFKYECSSLCLRYKIPKNENAFEVEVRVYWNEKDRMLKLSIPSVFSEGGCRGQVAYGVEDFKARGVELVAQKWIGLYSANYKHALTVINDGTHGFDIAEGELRISLLRSAAYAAHPVGDNIYIVPQDRLEPRIDQGERLFRFWVEGGQAPQRFASVDREALLKNETPMVLSCSPPGAGEKPQPIIFLDDSVVQVTAIKKAEDENWLILRLFEPTGEQRTIKVALPCRSLSFEVTLGGFEIRSLAVDLDTDEVFEVDLLERKLD
ncbi:MAG: glycoside hydrolase family 38 C-terminal domain-containing protein [Candidatus Aminicenantes bacterium]